VFIKKSTCSELHEITAVAYNPYPKYILAACGPLCHIYGDDVNQEKKGVLVPIITLKVEQVCVVLY